MICTALMKKNVDELIQALKSVDLAEIRFDALEVTRDEMKKIIAANKNIVATKRPTNTTEEARAEVLQWAIECGAAYVDLEIEAGDDFKNPLIQLAKEKGCKVIISYHNYEKTPNKSELDNIVQSCFDQGADIAKVACEVANSKEAARILGLGDNDRPVITLGMGEKGKITRVAAPLAGSLFTFASLNSNEATAPGQLAKETLENIYKMF